MKQPSGMTFIALGRVQTLLQGLGGYTCGCTDVPPRRKTSHIFEGCNPLYIPIPSVILPVKEKGALLLDANKDYKGLPARSHRKVQTCCHLRGNFPCLGEERVLVKSTEFLADMAARLLGCEEQPPDRTGPTGCSPRKLSSSISSTEDHAGGRAGGHHPSHRLPESNLVARGTVRRTATKPGTNAMVRHLHPPSG